MGQPLPLRADYDAPALRVAARRSRDAAQARRLLALAAIYDGASRTEAARIGTVTLRIVRDWVVRFNAAGPEGLVDRRPPGSPPRLTDAHRAALAETPVFGILERGGRVHTQIVRNCSKATLQAVIRGRVDLSASIHSDGWRAYDGLVEAGFAKHHRIRHQDDQFALDGTHINGIESFWSFSK